MNRDEGVLELYVRGGWAGEVAVSTCHRCYSRNGVTT